MLFFFSVAFALWLTCAANTGPMHWNNNVNDFLTHDVHTIRVRILNFDHDVSIEWVVIR